MKTLGTTTFRRDRRGRNRRRGGAMLLAVVAVVVLAGLAGAILNVSVSAQGESRASRDSMRALYNSEAGVSHGLANISIGSEDSIASMQNPVVFGGGGYSVNIANNGDGTFTLLAVGAFNTEQKAIEVVARMAQTGPFANAIFAGNEDGDPNYDLEFGGVGVQADDIGGGVYSGGNIDVVGDAVISGPVVAAGGVSGVPGIGGESQSLPNIAGMDYPNNHDVDVLQEFIDNSSWTSDSYGGSAYQVPEANPGHIFRANPSDRSSENSSTTKHDFYLEDPYESVDSGSAYDGSTVSRVTLSGGSDPGIDGNGLVYYIDGNLWVHNYTAYSFMIEQAGSTTGVQVTMVVRGNVYFSDNLYYEDPKLDGLAIIAIEDPAVADSGNIYFGDSSFGTLENMDAFLYAQNNFYDNNLSADGSKEVTINGTMSAGNQVKIDRTFLNHHSKLTINFDDRISSGTITLPGLPDQSGADPGISVLSWREVPVPTP